MRDAIVSAGALPGKLIRATSRALVGGSKGGSSAATPAPGSPDSEALSAHLDEFGSVFVGSVQRAPQALSRSRGASVASRPPATRDSSLSQSYDFKEDSTTLLEASLNPSERIAAAAAAATELSRPVSDRGSSTVPAQPSVPTGAPTSPRRRRVTSGADEPLQGGAGVVQAVLEEVPNSAVLLRAADELVFRLPRESVQTFPAMLRRLEVCGAPATSG